MILDKAKIAEVNQQYTNTHTNSLDQLANQISGAKLNTIKEKLLGFNVAVPKYFR